jgi:transcription elongation GreA/GreB family factor
MVTPAGLMQIEARVSELEALVAVEADETRLAEAKRDLRYWRTRLATAQVAPPPPDGQAAIGSHVRFRLKGQVKTMQIVGDDEADPASGRISFSSPLGRALVGAEVDDLIDFGGQAEAIEILALS